MSKLSDNYLKDLTEKDAILSSLYKFFTKGKIIRFSKGDSILMEGDEPPGFYLIIKGYININHISPEGNRMIMDIQGKGYCFPLTWIYLKRTNLYNFEAMNNVILLRVPVKMFEDYISKKKEIADVFIKDLILRDSEQINFLQELLISDAEEKIVRVLKRLCARFSFSKENGTIIKVPITHQDIADMANVSREVTSTILSELKEKEEISYDRKRFLISPRIFPNHKSAF